MLVPWFAGSPLPLCCPMGSPEGVGWAEELVAKFLGSAAFPDPSSSGSEPSPDESGVHCFSPPPSAVDPSSPEEKLAQGPFLCRGQIRLSVERTRLSVLRHVPCSSVLSLPRRPTSPRAPRVRAPQGQALLLPGAERATGVLPQLADRGVR